MLIIVRVRDLHILIIVRGRGLHMLIYVGVWGAPDVGHCCG